MKAKHFILLLCTCMLMSCVWEEGTTQEEKREKIEKTANDAKNLIDEISKTVKNIADDNEGNGDELKSLISKLADKSKGIKEFVDNNKGEWKEKVAKIKESPELKKLLEDVKSDGDGAEIIKQLEEILNEVKATDTNAPQK